MKRIPAERLKELDSRDAVVSKASRRAGHTSLVVDRPCQKHGPSILKRKAVPTGDAQPKKRLRRKTRPNEA